MLVSIVVPTLNEESSIATTIGAIAQLRGSYELILVDGGSTDRTVEIARQTSRVLLSERGRGRQQALGADAALGDVLWFLHADTLPDRESLGAIAEILKIVRWPAEISLYASTGEPGPRVS